MNFYNHIWDEIIIFFLFLINTNYLQCSFCQITNFKLLKFIIAIIQIYTTSHLPMDRSPLHITKNNTKSIHITASKHQDIKQFQVICRVRPLQQSETPSDILINDQTITIFAQGKNIFKEFNFNKIYKEDTAQSQFTHELAQDIFNNCRLNGKGSLVLSYGVTNSGKTYTILGTEEQPGLLPNIISKIEKEFPNEAINITAIQAYNDEFYSLKDKQRLFPKQTWGTYQFQDYQPQIITHESTKEMIKQYMVNRNQTDTKANKKSSRSHAIFKIQCDQLSLAIVDLAGSERIGKAGTNIQQTTSINTSLLVLGKCIHAFRDAAIIPFRECKLTKALTEYFSPRFKIYMIAHINRSGQMFHQNVKVLEYAAVSSQVRQINPNVNRSIVKSARKRNLCKSAIKIQNSAINAEDQQNQIKSCMNQPSAHNKNGKTDKIVQIAQIQDIIEKQSKRRKRQYYQKYINQIIGRTKEFDYYLDRQFEKQDQKDREFIRELNSVVYESPIKRISTAIQIKKAQSRITLRKQILEELEKEKIEKMIDAHTDMGPSMRKCLQESIRKDIERNIKNNQNQVNIQTDRITIYQPKNKINQQSENSDTNQLKMQDDADEPQYDQNSVTTPKRVPEKKQQLSQSLFKRVMKNPLLMIQSGLKMITSLHTANKVSQSISKLVMGEKSNNFKKDMRKSIRSMLNMKIQNVIDIIHIPTEIINSQKQLSHNISEHLKEATQKSIISKEETNIFKNTNQLIHQQFQSNDHQHQTIERGVGNFVITEKEQTSSYASNIPFDNYQSTIDENSSTNTNTNSNVQQFAHQNNHSILHSIPQSQQSLKNSPFFRHHRPETQENDHSNFLKLLNQNSKNKNTQSQESNIVSNDTRTKYQKQNHQENQINLNKQLIQNSQINSSRTYGPLKSRYISKPQKKIKRMKFVTVSPIKTRSQRNIVQKPKK